MTFGSLGATVMSIRPSWLPVVGLTVLDAGARVHRRSGRVGAPADGGAVHEPVRVRGDRREGRAAAGWHRGRVEAVGAVLAEVVLPRRCEPARADRGDDPRGLYCPCRRARARRRLAVESRNRSSCTARSSRRRRCRRRRSPSSCPQRPWCSRSGRRAPCRLSRTAGTARRLGVSHSEDVLRQQLPGRAGVGRLQDALAAHGEGAVVEIPGARVDRVVVGGVDREGVDGDRREPSGSSACLVQVVLLLQQLVVFQTPPPILAA